MNALVQLLASQSDVILHPPASPLRLWYWKSVNVCWIWIGISHRCCDRSPTPWQTLSSLSLPSSPPSFKCSFASSMPVPPSPTTGACSLNTINTCSVQRGLMPFVWPTGVPRSHWTSASWSFFWWSFWLSHWCGGGTALTPLSNNPPDSVDKLGSTALLYQIARAIPEIASSIHIRPCFITNCTKKWSLSFSLMVSSHSRPLPRISFPVNFRFLFLRVCMYVAFAGNELIVSFFSSLPLSRSPSVNA